MTDPKPKAMTVEIGKMLSTRKEFRDECLRLAGENAALKAEVERLSAAHKRCAEIGALWVKMEQGEGDTWKARAEKAEAELAKYKTTNEKYWQMLQGQGTELARYRRFDKLIEAVEKASIGKYQDIVGASPVLIPFISEGEDDILRAALSCREEK